MFAFTTSPLYASFRSLLATLFAPEAALALCYAAGLLTSRMVGEGAAGQPILAMGAPVALGVLMRAGRSLTAKDAIWLPLASGAVAIGVGMAPSDWLWALARDLCEIAAGSALFARIRAAGIITSPLRLAAAAASVSIASPLAAAPLDLIALALDPAVSADVVVLRFLADSVSMSLTIGLILTYGRGSNMFATIEPGDDEPRPRLWEFVAAGLVLAALTCGAADGRLIFSLAASVALLWFALRLGPFATTVAAFSFTTALLCFAAEGRWPAFLTTADPIQTDLLRYCLLALLAAPCIAVAGVVHDQKRLKRMFAYRASHDGLTTLVNRCRFIEALDGASVAARSRGKRFALLLIDLDHFKTVNDTYGHARGDRLLIEISARLRASVRATDLVARIGGDEFAVVAPVPTIADAMSLSKRLVDTVNQTCDLGGVSVRPSITLGGVLAPDSATDPQQLMLLADEALYEAKAAGRNCWRFASAERVEAPRPAWRQGDIEAVPETVFLD